MSERYSIGWTDARMPNFSAPKYAYQVRYAFDPRGYKVVKYDVARKWLEEVLAHSLTFDEAHGFLKLLKEDDDG